MEPEETETKWQTAAAGAAGRRAARLSAARRRGGRGAAGAGEAAAAAAAADDDDDERAGTMVEVNIRRPDGSTRPVRLPFDSKLRSRRQRRRGDVEAMGAALSQALQGRR